MIRSFHKTMKRRAFWREIRLASLGVCIAISGLAVIGFAYMFALLGAGLHPEIATTAEFLREMRLTAYYLATCCFALAPFLTVYIVATVKML